jgi:hypothetical protein
MKLIRISQILKKELDKKRHGSESYEEIIWNLVEDTMEVNEKTKRDIGHARAEYMAGKFYTFEQVKKMASGIKRMNGNM